VTNFYDPVFLILATDITTHPPNSILQGIINDPMSEEQQGRNIAKAIRDAGVQCFMWSTMHSSIELSEGRLASRVYEGTLQMQSYLESIFILIQVNTWSMLISVSSASMAFFSTRAISTKTWSYGGICLITKKPTSLRSNSLLSSQMHNVYPPGSYMPLLADQEKLQCFMSRRIFLQSSRQVFDQWDKQQNELNGKYLQASNARVRPVDIFVCSKG
jgi:hypothetical protein